MAVELGYHSTDGSSEPFIRFRLIETILFGHGIEAESSRRTDHGVSDLVGCRLDAERFAMAINSGEYWFSAASAIFANRPGRE